MAKSRGDNHPRKRISDWRLLKRYLFLFLKILLGTPQLQATWHMHKWKQVCQQTELQNVGRLIRCFGGVSTSTPRAGKRGQNLQLGSFDYLLTKSGKKRTQWFSKNNTIFKSEELTISSRIVALCRRLSIQVRSLFLLVHAGTRGNSAVDVTYSSGLILRR